MRAAKSYPIHRRRIRAKTPTAGSSKVEFLAPQGTRVLELMPTLFQVENGTFDLDDIVLVPIDPTMLRQATAAQKRNRHKPSTTANEGGGSLESERFARSQRKF